MIKTKALLFLFLGMCVLSLTLTAQEMSNPFGKKDSTLFAAKKEQIKFDILWSQDSFKSGTEVIAALHIQLDQGFHINPPAYMIPQNYVVEVIPTKVTVKAVSQGAIAQSPEYSQPIKEYLEFFESEMIFYKGETFIWIPVKINPEFQGEALSLQVDVYYQMCDERDCYRPKTVTVEGNLTRNATSEPKSIHEDIFAKRHLNEDLATAPANVIEIASSMLWLQFLLAFVGGMLLNFTPCVLPVIPLKIMSLSRSAGSRQKSFILGLIMALGVISFWMVIGILISSIPSFNAVSKLFQNSFFTIGVGVVIAIMAVGMCGLFNLQVPQKIATINPKFSSFFGSFGVGIMTAILSTPCTAPFMGGALAWALKQQPYIILLVFFAIGFGMALPYFILSSFPALVSWVPKSGPISVVIKETMGIFMLAAAAYFISIGLTTTIPALKGTDFYWWPSLLIVSFAGVFIIYQTFKLRPTKSKKIFFTGLGFLFLIGGILLLKSLLAASPLTWQNYTPELLEQAQKDKKNIILDFTADYCINCKYLEKTVLNQPSVVQTIKSQNTVLIKVDITDEKDVQNIKLLNEEGSLTVPYLVIYKDGKKNFNADFYTIADIINTLTGSKKE